MSTLFSFLFFSSFFLFFTRYNTSTSNNVTHGNNFFRETNTHTHTHTKEMKMGSNTKTHNNFTQKSWYVAITLTWVSSLIYNDKVK